MKKLGWLCAAVFGGALALTGCNPGSGGRSEGPAPAAPAAGGEDAEVRANLAKLSPDDRTLAEGQLVCAVEEENRLGSMGAPVKVVLKDRPVFLCCEGCRKKALADPDKAAARAQELRAKNAGPSGK